MLAHAQAGCCSSALVPGTDRAGTAKVLSNPAFVRPNLDF